MRDHDVRWFSAGLLTLLLGGTSATAATPAEAAVPEDGALQDGMGQGGAITRLDGIAAGLRDRLGPPPDEGRPAAGGPVPERHAQGWQNWPNWSNFWQNF